MKKKRRIRVICRRNPMPKQPPSAVFADDESGQLTMDLEPETGPLPDNAPKRKPGRRPLSEDPCTMHFSTCMTARDGKLIAKKCAERRISPSTAFRDLGLEWIYSPRFTCQACGCRFQICLNEANLVGDLYGTYHCPKCGKLIYAKSEYICGSPAEFAEERRP